MDSPSSTLIIPVENQVRELDAKILLSCFAAEMGFPVIIGSRAYTHFSVGSMPRGVYVAKSMRGLSNLMFRILRKLGHKIVAWEEEALVHPPAEIYFTLRLSPITINLVSHIFAWGQDNFDLLQKYPYLPTDVPIHNTGNPRGDMLRPEIRPYFDAEVKKLHESYGQFILVNTNFSDVNPYIPDIGLFLPAKKAGEKPRFGQAGKGMTREFAEGLEKHKQTILEYFISLIPELSRKFPDLNIVVRPHPSENLEIYHKLASDFDRVHIDNTGNVIPWLLASRLMIHNGCTTGVEAYSLGVPAVAYLPIFNKLYDHDFQGLPNKLSHECSNLESLLETVEKICAGLLSTAQNQERDELVNYYISSRQGKFACERILNVLEEYGYLAGQPSASPKLHYFQARAYLWLKSVLTKLYMRRPGPNRKAYHDHRFPEISTADLEERIKRFGRIFNRFGNIRVEEYSKHLFKISDISEDTSRVPQSVRS